MDVQALATRGFTSSGKIVTKGSTSMTCSCRIIGIHQLPSIRRRMTMNSVTPCGNNFQPFRADSSTLLFETPLVTNVITYPSMILQTCVVGHGDMYEAEGRFFLVKKKSSGSRFFLVKKNVGRLLKLNTTQKLFSDWA